MIFAAICTSGWRVGFGAVPREVVLGALTASWSSITVAAAMVEVLAFKALDRDSLGIVVVPAHLAAHDDRCGNSLQLGSGREGAHYGGELACYIRGSAPIN